jgi:putative endonuclease
MKTSNRETGMIGENIACDFLVKKGYKILSRNYSTKFGEIDIVAIQKGVTVFVEVKTKKGLEYGSPEEMFGKSKSRRVKNMAIIYLGGKETLCRIDMVAVLLDRYDQLARVTHYENVG